MGAVVRAFDVRPVTKEQVEAMGGQFLEVDYQEDGTWASVGGTLSGAERSQFGEAVRCNADCSVIAVGAPEDCSSDGTICGGSVYVYQISSSF